jgi:Flp pilus assembly pilin Flp
MMRLHTLARDERGATIVEFALIAPVLLLTLFGMFDIGHSMYTKALLQGAIERAARDSTIQGTSSTTLDNRVKAVVGQIVPGADPTFARTYYTNFGDVSQPEDYTDTDGSSSCDNGETYEDANGNGQWDSSRGRIGRGGARDAVVYKVTVSFPRLFPIAAFIGQSNITTMSAIAVLRNQPYGLQNFPSQTRTCA